MAKHLKRTESSKSHSWWWDSHISPKNSKWLAENLEQMDHSVKRMLKLIEEDGDSFAKKAQMYYQRRPELISLVEQFYRMYRSLAERYDHLTGELRKSIPSDLQSQTSSTSEAASELTSASGSPLHRLSRLKSDPRAPGIDVFLGSAGSSSDVYGKGDESSSLADSEESESESDDSSIKNYSAVLENGPCELGQSRKIIESETEPHKDADNLLAKVAVYEKELRLANEKMQLFEDEITRLRLEVQKYKSWEGATFESTEEKTIKIQEAGNGVQMHQRPQVQAGVDTLESKSEERAGDDLVLEEELSLAQKAVQDSKKDMAALKLKNSQLSEEMNYLLAQLESAQKGNVTSKSKQNAEGLEICELQERIASLLATLSEREHEIRELKIAVSDAEKKALVEKAEITKLLEEQRVLKGQLREYESRSESLIGENRSIRMEKRDCERSLGSEIEQLKEEIDRRDGCIGTLEGSLGALKFEEDKLQKEIDSMWVELSCRDEEMDKMGRHLHQLHLEHALLIANAEEAHKLVADLKFKRKELEEEIERKNRVIEEGEEEKREAIRQLCFSLEHYRDGYHRLRQAVVGFKRFPAVAV